MSGLCICPVYDLRKRELKEGLTSGIVSSTPVFEMYSVKFIGMLSHMVKKGYQRRIADVSVHMLMNRNFGVEKCLEKINAGNLGIDLRWPHHTIISFCVSREKWSSPLSGTGLHTAKRLPYVRVMLTLIVIRTIRSFGSLQAISLTVIGSATTK